MQTINISLSKIKSVIFGKNIFGRLTAGSFAAINTEAWENEAFGFLKSDEIVITLPNESSFVQKLRISQEIVGTALEKTVLKKAREQLGLPDEELSYCFERKGSEVLFYAAKKEQIEEILKSKKFKSLAIIPKILADFEVFKKGIAEDEITVYIELEKNNVHFSFFDHFGPVVYFIKTGDLEDEVIQTVADFEKRQDRKVKRIILGGSEAVNINLDYFSKKVSIWTTKAEKILQERVNEFDLKVNAKNESPVLFLTNFGAYFYSFKSQKLNLFKNNQPEEKKKQTAELKVKASPDVLREFNQPSAKFMFPKKISKKFLSAILVFLILIAILFFSWRFLTKKSEKESTVEQTKTIESPTPAPTQMPTPKLEKSDLKIQVLNGSGKKGAASSLKKFLIEKGYDKDIDTANADAFNYEETIIKIKEDKKSYLSLLINDLKGEYRISSETAVLDGNSDFDAVIVVGKED